jgi:hypothetical protein
LHEKRVEEPPGQDNQAITTVLGHHSEEETIGEYEDVSKTAGSGCVVTDKSGGLPRNSGDVHVDVDTDEQILSGSAKHKWSGKKSIVLVLAVLVVLVVALPLTTKFTEGVPNRSSSVGRDFVNSQTPISTITSSVAVNLQRKVESRRATNSSTLISQNIVQAAFDSTWRGFAEAFATGNRQSLNKYADQSVQQAVAGWYECGCSPWPTAYNSVDFTAPPQATYPLSFLAEIHQRDYDLSPLGVDAVFTKESAKAPWLISYLVSFIPSTGSIPDLSGTSIGAEPPPIPFDITIVGSQFASFFTTVFDTCSIPAQSWPQTGSMAQETNRILEDCQALPAEGLKESLTYQATAHSPAFALPGGDFMCGELRWTSTITTTTGKPVVQPADQSEFGPELAPGSFGSVTNDGVRDACWFGDVNGGAHPVSFFGGVYNRIGNPS